MLDSKKTKVDSPTSDTAEGGQGRGGRGGGVGSITGVARGGRGGRGPVNINGVSSNNGLKTAQAQLHAATTATIASSTVGVVGSLGMNPVSGRPFTMPGSTSAGAGAPNFTGTWRLDREASDSMNDYLQAMGLPDIARQAADKLDLTVVINQNDDDFIITRKTRIFTETKPLKFGHEMVFKSNTIKVIGDSESVQTFTKLSMFNGSLHDTRTFSEDKKRMKVALKLTLPDQEPVITYRYFNKWNDSVSLVDIPIENDTETVPSTENKRKR